MVESTDIGDLNEFQARAVVQDGCKIENFCTINACVTLSRGTHLPSNTVVYDDGGKMLVNTELNEEAKKQTVKELCHDLLTHLPNYNKAREP